EKIAGSDGPVFGCDLARNDSNHGQWDFVVRQRLVHAVLAGYDAGLCRGDPRHERGVRSLRQGQTPLTGRINHQQVARCIVFRTVFYRYGLREISPEWPESPIGVDRAVAIYAKHSEFGASSRGAYVTPNDGAGVAANPNEPSAIALRAHGYPHYADCGAACAEGIAPSRIGEARVAE